MTNLTDAPRCSHTGHPLHLREATGQDFAWSDEGVLYSLKAAPLSYEQDYFFAEYERAYGKTYEEDEPNLRALARRRLDLLEIWGFSRGEGRNILEIGCATGTFLDEARSRGYDPTGIEISRWACEQARTRRGLQVHESSFLDFGKANTETNAGPGTSEGRQERFDVIAAFYVIEHFADQKVVFQKISSLLKQGGFFICALPSIRGPLFHCDRQRWMETHPADHYVDYSPASLRRIMPLYDLEPVIFRPASYHRERSCGLMRRLPGPLYRIIADLTACGDTIEFIARKKTGQASSKRTSTE